MEALCSVFIVMFIFFFWLPLFMFPPGSSNNIYEFSRNVVFLRKILRTSRTRIFEKSA